MPAKPVFILICFLGSILLVNLAQADDSIEALLEKGQQLLNEGQIRQAIEFLKKEVRQHPDNGPLSRLLALSYLAEKNDFWALRVLGEHAARTGDCETKTWIAWLHLRKGELDQAEMILEQEQCAVAGPTGARWHMLLAILHHFKNQPSDALEDIDIARKSKNIFSEDKELLQFLNRTADLGYIPPIVFRFEHGYGFNSNALMSSIVEEGEEEVESAFSMSEHEVRFVAPVSKMLRPALEYRGRLKAFMNYDAKDVSYYEMTARAGFLFGYNSPRVGLYYANENLILQGGDTYDGGPRWFLESHRGEFEFEAIHWLFAFGGAGRKAFRERARSRTEYDGGFATQVPLPAKLSITGIVTGRFHDAQIDAYNLLGGSALLALRLRYVRDGFLRIGGMGSIDDYPDSEDYFETNESRQDVLVRAIPAIWSPSMNGFRFGITYNYSDRNSTIDEYSYQGHEFLFKFAWQGFLDPWIPHKIRKPNHIDLEYGLSQQDMYEERIQDLLRQEDAARRSSSCINR